MAGDRRTRRLTDDAVPSQRTLDSATSAPDLTPELEPPELLEPPTVQQASVQLEERQKRWFQLRERAMEKSIDVSPSASESAGTASSDPKG
jgi:hypothetical protein